ncbi:efflux RND transporter periplasmic adaptor subunit [Alteromonas sediminis]|uniref:Efflux RND transporter periplasmic adaptor subunit n=1 Tax=Alteromonas sediminis TaxID=2259342 RepID=A0A3N5ZCA9_9ALTE|nr:efflux RND transporter periplasmic adaptor subunit [Alteromonas sediminis]RPJ67498.1 efflux RND transporter periplasmic adaptor subunit [Alteromonas sediminis]
MKKTSMVKSALPFAIIIIAVIVAFVMINMRKPPEKEEVVEKAFLVEAQEVFREPVEFVVFSQGNVQPKNHTRISTQVSGKVVSVSSVFQAGGFFKQGDILVTLEQDDFLTDLKLAEAELAQARASLEEEKARGKVAEEDWKALNNSTPPALGLRKPQLAREQANVKAAEAKYERAMRNLARTEVRAPYNGIVVKRDVDVGQFLPVGSIVGEVYSTDVAEVRLPLANSDLAFLDLSAGVESNNPVQLKADVAGRERVWSGRLVRSEGVMDAGSRVMYAVVEVEDPYRINSGNDAAPLRFGQFVEAVISGTRSENVIVLPRNLLRLDNTVLTVSDEREIAIKPVQVARTDAERVYISEGLNSGEKVAVSAVPNPYNGMKVRLPGDEPEIEEPQKNDQAEEASAIDTAEAN